MLTMLLPLNKGVIVKTCLFIIQICNGIMRFAIIYKLLRIKWNYKTSPLFYFTIASQQSSHTLFTLHHSILCFYKWALHMTLNNKKTVDSSEWIMKYITESSPLCPMRNSKERRTRRRSEIHGRRFVSSLFPFIFIKRIV